MGGHSILAGQLIARIRSTFHVQLSLRQVFETPTVAELAAWIESTPRQSRTIKPLTRASSGRNTLAPALFEQSDQQ
jgi:hypothetical protein